MFKALSRSSVDLRHSEVISIALKLLNMRASTNNDHVPEFEKAFAAYVGVQDAVAFPLCRSGMYFALKALNLNEGDEVILPAFTFWVDAAVVVMAGLTPVFVDVAFETASMDPARIEAAITPRTKVIFPTHLNGLPADMDPIMEIARKHNLRVIEDCARSCGARYKEKRIGSFDIGTFSFGYGKSFYDFGGAMVTSSDRAFMKRLREIKKDFRNITPKKLLIQTIKGMILRYVNTPYLYRFSIYPMAYQYHVNENEKYASLFRVKMASYKSVPENFMVNMNNIQAWLGLKQLKRIDATNQKRMENARLLNKELSGIPGLVLPANPKDRDHLAVHYALWTGKKKELQAFLISNKIDAQDESAVDTTSLERFKPYEKGEFPNAGRLHDKVFFLPTHPCRKKKEILYIANIVKVFFQDATVPSFSTNRSYITTK